MMKEYEQYFSMTLQQKLKRKVVGKVYVKITKDDKVLILIENDDEMRFKLFVDDFANKFINGLTTDFIAYEALKEYKKICIRSIKNTIFLRGLRTRVLTGNS